MLNQNAKKWVAALRSGDYRQGKGALLTNEGYCCLGVACALYIHEGLGTAIEILGDPTAGHLPEVVKEWLNLSTRSGAYDGPEHRDTYGLTTSTWLVNDNDYGKTFSEIADIIESEPEGLFRKEEQNETTSSSHD